MQEVKKWMWVLLLHSQAFPQKRVRNEEGRSTEYKEDNYDDGSVNVLIYLGGKIWHSFFLRKNQVSWKRGKRAPTPHIVKLLNPETINKFWEWE